jgi:hypothetical protein
MLLPLLPFRRSTVCSWRISEFLCSSRSSSVRCLRVLRASPLCVFFFSVSVSPFPLLSISFVCCWTITIFARSENVFVSFTFFYFFEWHFACDDRCHRVQLRAAAPYHLSLSRERSLFESLFPEDAVISN